jgi:hypothetical protein
MQTSVGNDYDLVIIMYSSENETLEQQQYVNQQLPPFLSTEYIIILKSLYMDMTTLENSQVHLHIGGHYVWHHFLFLK